MKLLTHFSAGLMLSEFIFFMGLPLDIALFCILGSVFPKLDSVPPLSRMKGKVFHNVWLLIISSMVIALPGTTMMAISFAVGVLVHMLLDFFSKEGIYPLWPQEIISVRLRVLKRENLVVTPALSLLVSGVMVYYLGDYLLAVLGFFVAALAVNRGAWR